MPDYKKFSEIKSALSSLSKMVEDYEIGFGEPESGESADHEAGESPSYEAKEDEKNIFGDKEAGDGGQDFTRVIPTDNSNKATDPEAKKKKINMFSALLKKKLGK